MLMADRTGAFLAQLTAFLDNDFTGEIMLHCNRGTVRSMDLTQRIRRLEDADIGNSSGNSVLILPSCALTAVVGRP